MAKEDCTNCQYASNKTTETPCDKCMEEFCKPDGETYSEWQPKK